jgi:hypothetical protein
LAFGNGGNGGDPVTLYLTAGINAVTHGLFAAIELIPEPSTAALILFGGLGLIRIRAFRGRKV